ncbi:MAG: DUF2244 domain-containing protein [Pseudomonadota bacterium]
MPYTESITGSDYTLVTRRNNSLSPLGLRMLFVGMFLLFATVAIVFMWVVGTWLILPFSGLEIVVVAVVFYHITSHVGDYERIEISGDRVSVEQKDGRKMCKAEFQRAWVRVVLEEGEFGMRLLLRSHGREIELGRMVRYDERLALAKQLGRHLAE